VVCFFCIAVFALVAGSIVASSLDALEQALAGVAAGGKVERTSDTDSVAVFDLEVPAGGSSTRVTVTVFKEYGRVRIQVHSHVLSSEAVREVFDRVAKAIGAEVVEVSEPDDLHEHDDHPVDVDDSTADRARQRAEARRAEQR
jgi:hypothetical protein